MSEDLSVGFLKDSTVAYVTNMENVNHIPVDTIKYPVTTDNEMPDSALYIHIFIGNRASLCQPI